MASIRPPERKRTRRGSRWKRRITGRDPWRAGSLDGAYSDQIAYGSAGLAAAALVGCGAKPKTSSSSSAAGTTAQPRSGGDLKMWLTQDPFNLDVSTIGQSGPNSTSLRTVQTDMQQAGVHQVVVDAEVDTSAWRWQEGGLRTLANGQGGRELSGCCPAAAG